MKNNQISISTEVNVALSEVQTELHVIGIQTPESILHIELLGLSFVCNSILMTFS